MASTCMALVKLHCTYNLFYHLFVFCFEKKTKIIKKSELLVPIEYRLVGLHCMRTFAYLSIF